MKHLLDSFSVMNFVRLEPVVDFATMPFYFLLRCFHLPWDRTKFSSHISYLNKMISVRLCCLSLSFFCMIFVYVPEAIISTQ